MRHARPLILKRDGQWTVVAAQNINVDTTLRGQDLNGTIQLTSITVATFLFFR